MQPNTGQARDSAERCAGQHIEYSAHELGASDLYRNVWFYLNTFYKGAEALSHF